MVRVNILYRFDVHFIDYRSDFTLIATFIKPQHLRRIRAGYTLLERIRDFFK